MLGPFGAGEVAHQQRDAVVFRADARRERRRLFGERPSRFMPVSTCSAAPPRQPLAATEGVPFGELDQAADHRPR